MVFQSDGNFDSVPTTWYPQPATASAANRATHIPAKRIGQPLPGKNKHRLRNLHCIGLRCAEIEWHSKRGRKPWVPVRSSKFGLFCYRRDQPIPVTNGSKSPREVSIEPRRNDPC